MADLDADDQVGLDVRALREHIGMTQPQLAKRLGVSRRTIIRWEQGTTRPPEKMLRLAMRRIAQGHRIPCEAWNARRRAEYAARKRVTRFSFW